MTYYCPKFPEGKKVYKKRLNIMETIVAVVAIEFLLITLILVYY